MVPNNLIKPKCLIFSKRVSSEFENLLTNSGYQIFFSNNRKGAFKFILINRPMLIIIDAEYLPKNPNRIFQAFKISHSTPGILILAEKKHDCHAYSWIDDAFFEIIEVPFNLVQIELSLKRITESLHIHTKNLFYRDILVQAGLAFPVLILLTFLLARL